MLDKRIERARARHELDHPGLRTIFLVSFRYYSYIAIAILLA